MSVTEGYLRGVARGNAQAADAWQQRARELEEQLASANAQLASANAGLEAMRTLKDVAITELAKLAPGHVLTVRATQQQIVDKAYSANRKAKL
jgi:hypothetical protein